MATFFVKCLFLAKNPRDRIYPCGTRKMLITRTFARIIITTKRRLSRSVLLAFHRRESPCCLLSFRIAHALCFRRKSVLSFDFLGMVGKGIGME
jgi:hypothetical protein